MEPSCIDLYVFAGQSNVLGWGVGPLEMQRVLSAHRRLSGGAPVLLFEPRVRFGGFVSARHCAARSESTACASRWRRSAARTLRGRLIPCSFPPSPWPAGGETRRAAVATAR